MHPASRSERSWQLPPIPEDIDGLSAWAYKHGVAPLDWAINSAQIEITAWMHVCAGRADNPSSFPGYTQDLSSEALARKIVGTLLDAGWRMPGSAPGSNY